MGCHRRNDGAGWVHFSRRKPAAAVPKGEQITAWTISGLAFLAQFNSVVSGADWICHSPKIKDTAALGCLIRIEA